MRYLLSGIIALSLLCSACSSSPEKPPKSADLSTLEGQANYITSKNVTQKLAEVHINFVGNPFLLGAFDIRDGIPARVPEESYNELLEASRIASSPIAREQTNTDAEPEFPNGLRTLDERISYLTAREIAKSFGKNGIPVLPASMAVGLADTLSKDAPQISAAEEKMIVKQIREKIQNSDDDWAANRKQYYISEEKSFFAANITKANVTSLASGVQYVIVKKGKGKVPRAKDSVVVNYKGTLLDGREFDSSYSRNKADTFKLSDMIPGFTQAMTQVPEGSKVIIYIPSALAYGEKGSANIPAFAAVVFEVELLSVKSGFF
ncbi:MAG TPA: FKBP-type peptidyl-prolyl cis-trans isomerase [Cellvibrio sp.]|nr:FKBP-type peptidyl-prolyl cis-trans isomerase [Cellvibrio sp.]